eukprot:COSAG01_NODE_3460_length_6070_cov_10.278848_7_plen_101_part_00
MHDASFKHRRLPAEKAKGGARGKKRARNTRLAARHAGGDKRRAKARAQELEGQWRRGGWDARREPRSEGAVAARPHTCPCGSSPSRRVHPLEYRCYIVDT